ncbi:MAG: hypothetical protein AAFS10_05625 [Myxococcota bacterium]
MTTADPPTTSKRLSRLRALLHEEPGYLVHHTIKTLLAGWPHNDTSFQTALEYTGQHFERWPANLCTPAPDEMETLRKGTPSPQWSTVRTLPVEGPQWETSNIKALLYHPDSRLTRLRVGCDLRTQRGLEWCRRLAKALPDSNLTELDVYFQRSGFSTDRGAQVANTNTLLTNGALTLANALPNLQKLHLTQCHIHGDAAKALTMLPLPQLTELHLPRNAMEAAGAQILAGSDLLHQLTRLDLSFNGMGAQAIERFVHTTATAKLQALSLSGNTFGRNGAHALAQARHLNSLRELHLESIRPSSSIHKPWLHPIAEAPWLSGLTHLNLSNNGINDSDLRICIEAAQSPAQLTELNLARNVLSPASAWNLVRSPWAQSLTSLDLVGNSIGEAGVRELLRASRVTLRTLDLVSTPWAGSTTAPRNDTTFARLHTLRVPWPQYNRNLVPALIEQGPFPALRNLSLSYQATEQQLHHLITSAAFPQLAMLNVPYVHRSVSKAARKQLRHAAAQRGLIHVYI